MICKKELEDELKRLPKIRLRYIKENNLVDALETDNIMTTLKWILESDCECK